MMKLEGCKFRLALYRPENIGKSSFTYEHACQMAGVSVDILPALQVGEDG